jgi:hypothetical protein
VEPEERAALQGKEAPDTVVAAPRLADDVDALKSLTNEETPAVQRCRVSDTFSASYLLGDASGKGFGSDVFAEGVSKAQTGHWSLECQDQTSNWREANNLVSRIEDMAERQELSDREVFIFTDNIVFEGTFYKGHSASPKLNEIILRLRMAERTSGCILHVIHVAGTRMKRSGIDGLSRGDFLEGIMAGQDPLSFIPLNEGADDRVMGRVQTWVESWWTNDDQRPWCGTRLKLLQPADWFSLHTFEDPRLWIPPPAAMETVVEMFNEDRIAHPHIPHVFVVPRLMTHLWRKQLRKDADLLFTVACGASFWPSSMHEPLIVLIAFPFAHVPRYHGPWTVGGSFSGDGLVQRLEAGFKDPSIHGAGKFHDLEGAMPCLWKSAEGWSGALLRKFLDSQKSFPPVSQCLVRGMLQVPPACHLSNTGKARRRRKRRSGDGEGRDSAVQAGPKRRSLDGGPL